MIDAPDHIIWSKRDARWRSSSPESADNPATGTSWLYEGETSSTTSGTQEFNCGVQYGSENSTSPQSGLESESALSWEWQSEAESQAPPSLSQQQWAASYLKDKSAASISKSAAAQQYWDSPWDSPLLLPPVGDEETCNADVSLHFQGQDQTFSASPAPTFEGQRQAAQSSCIPNFESKGTVPGSSQASDSQDQVQASPSSNMWHTQDLLPAQRQASLSSHPPNFDAFRWESGPSQAPELPGQSLASSLRNLLCGEVQGVDMGSRHTPHFAEEWEAPSQSHIRALQSQEPGATSNYAPHSRVQGDGSVSSHSLNFQVPGLVSSSLNSPGNQDQGLGSASSHALDFHGQEGDIESGDDDSDEGEKAAGADVLETQRLLQHQQQQQQLSAQQELSEEELERLRALVLVDGGGQPSSIGSLQHANGKCKACVFVKLPEGCSLGVDCQFCHMQHKRTRKKNKLRPCKGKRDRYRRLLMKLKQAVEDDPHGFDIDAIDLPPSMVTSDTAVKQKLLSTVQSYIDAALIEREVAGVQSGDPDIASLIAPDFPPPTRLMNLASSPPERHHLPPASSCVMTTAGFSYIKTQRDLAGVDASHSLEVAARLILPQGPHQHQWSAVQASGYSSYLVQPCMGYTGRQTQWAPQVMPYEGVPYLPPAR